MSAPTTPYITEDQGQPPPRLYPVPVMYNTIEFIDPPPDTTIESSFEFFRVHFATIRDHVDSLKDFRPNSASLLKNGRTLWQYRLRLVVKEDYFGVRTLSLLSQDAPWQEMGYRAPRLEESLRLSDWLNAAYNRAGAWETLNEARRLYRTAHGFGRVKWLGRHIDRVLATNRSANFMAESPQELVNTLLVAQDTRAMKLYHDVAIVISGRLSKFTKDQKAFMHRMLSEKSIKFIESLHDQRQETMKQIKLAAKSLLDAIFDRARRHSAWPQYRKEGCVKMLYGLHFGPHMVQDRPESSAEPMYVFNLMVAVESLKNEKWLEGGDRLIPHLRRRLRGILLYNLHPGLLLDAGDMHPFLTKLRINWAEIAAIVGDETDSAAAASATGGSQDSGIGM
ncbi:hypothetical protein BDV06DRAFT_221078 [Aspergillus oleicola]